MMKPVEMENRKIVSALNGKKRKLDVLISFKKEKEKAIEELNNEINKIATNLNDKIINEEEEIHFVNETNNYAITQTEIDRTKRLIAFDLFDTKALLKLNETLKSSLSDAKNRELKAKKQYENVNRNKEIKLFEKNPKIDENYLKELQSLASKELELKHQKAIIQMLNDDITHLNSENQNHINTISNLKEQLIELNKYILYKKTSKKGTVRNLLMEIESQRDCAQLDLLVSKGNLQIIQQKHNKLNQNLESFPSILEKKKNKLNETNKINYDAREQLQESIDNLAVYKSQLKFMEAQKRLLTERIKKYREKEQKIIKRTKNLEQMFKKQMLIREFNEQKNMLKNCNLANVANTVEAMLKLGDEIKENSVQEISENSFSKLSFKSEI